MGTLHIQVRCNSVVTGLVLVLQAGGAGYGGATLANHNVVSATPVAQAQTTTSTTQSQSPMQGTGATWDSLEPLSQSWVSQVLAAPIMKSDAANGKLTGNKPILLTAYWCPFCHLELRELSKLGLLSKVQVVGAAFDSQEAGNKPVQVTKVSQATALYQHAMQSIKVPLQSSQVDYVMPGSSLDTLIESFPTLIEQHDGKWYYLNGYTSDGALLRKVV